MKKRGILKFFSIFLSVFIIFTALENSTLVYAQVNQKYGQIDNVQPDKSSPTDQAETGTVVGIISIAFLQVGKMAENLTSWLMSMLSAGTINSFPWADKIIFNVVPVLDVNFINPATGSLFTIGKGQIGDVIKNVYFTGLSIAVGFLSIIVGVMSIKMAISTIAAEKARYKESIFTFLTALVLLFGTHFLLSFTFYLNEKMVEVASQIVVSAVDKVGFNIGNTASNDSKAVISNLGQYFYDTALTQGGSKQIAVWKIDKAAPIPTILYLVFIIQSIMFLFSYFKRFYYVVILSVLAPFVVIYDFLTKSVS